MKPVSIICALALALSQPCFADTITILNWESYLSQELIDKWEAQSGHKIQQVFYDNEEQRDVLIANYEGDNIDLVMLDSLGAHSFARDLDTLHKLSDSSISPIYPSIDPRFKKNCGDYAIPYLWGTFGLAYRTDKVPKAPSSWNFILQPEPAVRGHIGLIDDYTDALVPALLLLGHPISTDQQSHLEAAFELMKKNSPNILTYEYSISFVESENADSLYVALAYSGDQHALNEKQNTDVWEYTTLNEGTVIWTDCLAILKSSPRKDIAEQLIEFLYQPENAAHNSETLGVASPVTAALKHQSVDLLEDTSVYPPKSIMEKSHSYTKLSSENLLLRNRINSALLKIHESP